MDAFLRVCMVLGSNTSETGDTLLYPAFISSSGTTLAEPTVTRVPILPCLPDSHYREALFLAVSLLFSLFEACQCGPASSVTPALPAQSLVRTTSPRPHPQHPPHGPPPYATRLSTISTWPLLVRPPSTWFRLCTPWHTETVPLHLTTPSGHALYTCSRRQPSSPSPSLRTLRAYPPSWYPNGSLPLPCRSRPRIDRRSARNNASDLASTLRLNRITVATSDNRRSALLAKPKRVKKKGK